MARLTEPEKLRRQALFVALLDKTGSTREAIDAARAAFAFIEGDDVELLGRRPGPARRDERSVAERGDESGKKVSARRTADAETMPRGWTDEMIDTLRRMWSDGKSPGAIAVAIGRCRAMVQMKAKKLGLPARGHGHRYEDSSNQRPRPGLHRGRRRGKGIAGFPERAGPIEDLVRYVRQQGDVVIRDGEKFKLNGRPLMIDELQFYANKIRKRQGKEPFAILSGASR